MKARRRKTAERPPGRYRVINPRGIPAGRFIIRERKGGKDTGRWFEGEEYDGDSVEHWLERGFIVPTDGGETIATDPALAMSVVVIDEEETEVSDDG